MKRTPYDMIREAETKMRTMILDLDRKKEERVIILINAVASFPYMSKYQIMQARLFLIDLYISHEIFGNACLLCETTLEEYPKAPVKKKLKSMQKIRDEHPDEFVFSADLNLADPDLCYKEPVLDAIYDPDFEAEVEERLAALPDGCRETFYKIRSERKPEDIPPFTSRELDIRVLLGMEKKYREE